MTDLFTLIIKATLAITSTAFQADGTIPSKYTCEGMSVNPPLHIGDLPANTKFLAIIVHDPDAPKTGGFTHWVIWNIDPTADMAENFQGGNPGLNGSGKPGYMGPCPPSGVHHYHFMVFALDTKLDLDPNTNKDQLEKAMEGHILAKGDLVGLYKKMK
jgi:Raf kinase inhibitor-like YbhB/YbcL family protein